MSTYDTVSLCLFLERYHHGGIQHIRIVLFSLSSRTRRAGADDVYRKRWNESGRHRARVSLLPFSSVSRPCALGILKRRRPRGVINILGHDERPPDLSFALRRNNYRHYRSRIRITYACYITIFIFRTLYSYGSCGLYSVRTKIPNRKKEKYKQDTKPTNAINRTQKCYVFTFISCYVWKLTV